MSNKRKFLAQYTDQEILRWYQWIDSTPNNKVDLNVPAIDKDGWYIELKHISDLTDEESIELQKIAGANHAIKDPLNYACLKKSEAIPVIDYLRTKGYAIPFMQYSVNDLISLGWIKWKNIDLISDDLFL